MRGANERYSVKMFRFIFKQKAVDFLVISSTKYFSKDRNSRTKVCSLDLLAILNQMNHHLISAPTDQNSQNWSERREIWFLVWTNQVIAWTMETKVRNAKDGLKQVRRGLVPNSSELWNQLTKLQLSCTTKNLVSKSIFGLVSFLSGWEILFSPDEINTII